MNTEKLIEELRKVYEYYFCSTVVHPSGLNVRMMAKNCADKLEEMKDELAKAKRRAERAVEWIQEFTESIDQPCIACKYNTDSPVCNQICGGCGLMGSDSCKWKWRGDAEEGK